MHTLGLLDRAWHAAGRVCENVLQSVIDIATELPAAELAPGSQHKLRSTAQHCTALYTQHACMLLVARSLPWPHMYVRNHASITHMPCHPAAGQADEAAARREQERLAELARAAAEKAEIAEQQRREEEAKARKAAEARAALEAFEAANREGLRAKAQAALRQQQEERQLSQQYMEVGGWRGQRGGVGACSGSSRKYVTSAGVRQG